MTRKPHDEFAKQYLKGLLEPLGTAEVSREVSGEFNRLMSDLPQARQLSLAIKL